jgi:hypothetical protein
VGTLFPTGPHILNLGKGIVTRLSMATYPIHLVWGGIKGYGMDQLSAVFDAVLEYQTAPNKDPYANLMLQGFATNASLGLLLSVVYLKPEESPSAFSPFYNLTTLFDTTKIQTLTEFLASQGAADLPR